MRKIEQPVLQPYTCRACPSGYRGGPVIDTEVEDFQGRVYFCLTHAKAIAQAAGFAEGEELEKLQAAALALAEAEKGMEERDARLVRYHDESRSLAEEIEALHRQLEQAEGRAKQAEDALEELGAGIAATVAAVHREPEIRTGPPFEPIPYDPAED